MIRRLLDHPARRRLVAALGGDPLAVLVLLACFALAGYAFYRASFGPRPLRMLVWFVAAILAHDAVLYPLYAIADGSRHLFTREVRRRVRAPGAEPLVPAVNYLRIPTMLSGLLLIVFWGVISKQSQATLEGSARQGDGPFLSRWLIITGILFGVSALLYAVSLGRARRRAGSAVSGATA